MHPEPGDASAQDAAFRAAVASIDAGDVAALAGALAERPSLVRERLEAPGAWLRDVVGAALDGFFARPYLLWFVAEDPVRHGRLPSNIADVARLLVDAARDTGPAVLQEQLDYAMTLVSWSWIARQCGVQLALIDVLADAGAALDGNPNNALVNGNVDAARHLVGRGATLTLGTALCLGRWDDAQRIAVAANAARKQFALVLSALNGNADAVRRAVALGADSNVPSDALYPHGTPLHHAVASGSLETVRAMVEAGASLTAVDTAWQGTPLGWARHYVDQAGAGRPVREYAAIAAYLASLAPPAR